MYYHLSRYGEDLARPTLLGVMTILLSTLYWSGLPSGVFGSGYLDLFGKAMERSIIDYIPFIIPAGLTIEDSIVKSVGVIGIVFIAIAMRRKFERKFRN